MTQLYICVCVCVYIYTHIYIYVNFIKVTHIYIYIYFILKIFFPLWFILEFLISEWVLLKLSLFTPILFLNLLNIFITNAVNSFSGILFISVSVFFFRHFLWLFHLRIFSLPFHLLNFLCLYECRWTNYLLWSSSGVHWMTIIMQSHAAVSWWESWIWWGWKSCLVSMSAGSYSTGRGSGWSWSG